MQYFLVKNVIILCCVFIFLSGCDYTKPYIYIENEFDRNSPNFNRVPDDIADLRICYNKLTTNPNQIRKLAEENCKQYGKNALILKQDTLYCPLMTPAGAIFSCK